MRNKSAVVLSVLIVIIVCSIGMLGGYVRNTLGVITTTQISNNVSPTINGSDDKNINQIIQETSKGNGTYEYICSFFRETSARFPWQQATINITRNETKYSVTLGEGNYYLSNPIKFADLNNFSFGGAGIGNSTLFLSGNTNGIEVSNVTDGKFNNINIFGGQTGFTIHSTPDK